MATAIVVCGNSGFDLAGFRWEQRRINRLVSECEGRVCMGLERLRQLKEAREHVCGLIFPSGYAAEGKTMGALMEAYTEPLLALIERDHGRRVPIIANRTDTKVVGLAAQMRWAYAKAQNRVDDPRLEFLMTEWQGLYAGFLNWSTVRIPRWCIIPETKMVG